MNIFGESRFKIHFDMTVMWLAACPSTKRSYLVRAILGVQCMECNITAVYTGRFPCGRWLGRGIDDDSTERLLVGELVPRNVDSEELVETCRTPPPRCHSPSVPRRSQDTRPSVAEIQHMLGKKIAGILKPC